jgi:3-phenylpropionate/trans-cinnamate dioxygenase ferredoxin reductase subunit
MSHIVIIGNGIAGITAARHLRKNSDHRITVISSETDHFFSRTALMYIYMGHMKYEHTKPYEDDFWAKNRINLVRDWIQAIDFEKKQLTGEKSHYDYDELVLALGSKPNKFGWPGQDLKGVQGLYSFQDLETMEQNTKNIQNAVVVGGGLIGIEMAEMLHSRGIHVTYLVREPRFWDIVLPEGESIMIEKHIRAYGIDLRLDTELEEIIHNGKGRAQAIKTTNGEVIEADFVGLTVGVAPNVDWLRDSPLDIQKGIMVDEFLKTNLPDVYAIGDCAQQRHPQSHRKPIEAVWYTGRMMGETIAKTLSGAETKYHPGIWFNSAKFFDIEYQTYGNVSPKESERESHFYWEAADQKHAMRIAYHPSNYVVTGVNTLGMRLRHEVWDGWLKRKITITEIIKKLGKSNFDPEFFKRFEPEIQAAYNQHFQDHQVVLSRPTLFQRLLNR